ncbi:hypothetical protein COLO4_16243 [Corchorus olitorius]|uniref:non-specific serine/threonine protein kinase n=1 Tax=Corchorus olitorius TaxID=93759 RepID=A0A1R3JIF0_9ROSI|nr:hypothetical protein COLO4_16243 [Corchorus olitorius]
MTNKLGQGGFGPVYKGKLHDGKHVAVKRLSSSSGQGIEEFKNEVVLISKLQHRNLVRLFGYCTERDERILIYEFMANKSLDTFLFDPTKRAELDWPKRFNIIQGVARGLLYLHRDSCLRVIHRDLKAWQLWYENKELELLDETLGDSFSPSEVTRCIHVALLCVQDHVEDRPNMSAVVSMFSSEGKLPQPKQPTFTFQSRMFSERSDSIPVWSPCEVTESVLQGR